MTTQHTSRWRTATLITIIMFSVLAVGTMFTATAGAQTATAGDLVETDDQEVSPDGEIEILLTAQQDGEITLEGDTLDWTIVEMDPFNHFTVPNSFDNELPYESADERWSSGIVSADDSWQLVVAPPADAADGDTYEFDVEHTDSENNHIASDSFTITVTESSAEFDITAPTDGTTQSATASEAVSIDATVENVGDESGDTTVEFLIDGDRVDSKTLTGIQTDETDTVSVDGVAPATAGTYDWTIDATSGDAVSGELDVSEPKDDDTSEESDYQVSPTGSLAVSFPVEADGEIVISGETAGWTITEMEPFGLFTVPSSNNDDLPYTAQEDETWSSGPVNTGESFDLTLEPPETATNGESYEFVVTSPESDSDQNSEETITITIAEETYEDLPESVDQTTAAAVDREHTGEISLDDIVDSNIERVNNDGEVDGVEVSLDQLVELNFWRIN